MASPYPVPGDQAHATNKDAIYRDRAPETVGFGERPEPPAWLRQDAADFWDILLHEMAVAGTLSRVDFAIVAVAANTIADYIAAEAAVAEHGLVISQPSGRIAANPAAAMRDKARKALVDTLRQCGLTPASRRMLALAMAPESAGHDEDDAMVVEL